MSFNIIMRIVFGKCNFGPELDDLKEALNFLDMIKEFSEVSKASYQRDLLPFLQWIDFEGMKKTLSRLKTRSDAFLEDLSDDYRKKDGVSNKTMIDDILSLQESQPENYSDQITKGIILTLVLAGTDTSAVTIEWAMSLLLNHPNVLEELRLINM